MKGLLRFVVQKHDASHLHYDFRLEMEGVLKSWAVPKGPSLNTADKRLAMMVEDHPYDYRNFEGIIPEGNYGAGTVIVWDEGTYEPLQSDDLGSKEQQKVLLKQLFAGNLKIILHGKKLKGEFALFQMKGRQENAWILMKKDDKYASEKNVLDKNKSVKTGKTLVKVAHENGMEVNHPEGGNRKVSGSSVQVAEKKSSAKKTSQPSKKNSYHTQLEKKFVKTAIKDLLGNSFFRAKKSAIPKDVIPMLATLADESFDDEKWLYEIKWDGYRAMAYCHNDEVELRSRNLISFKEKFSPVADELKGLKLNAVLDGEIVAVNEKGLAVFQLLQSWQQTRTPLQFFIFDILWLDGYDLTALPLIERKRILQQLLPNGNNIIKYSDHIVGKGKEFFDAAVSQQLEGIIAKKIDGIYEPGKRTADWLKIKSTRRQELIIAGYTEPKNSRQYFGSLLLGFYEDGKLIYAGHTGSGFNQKSLKEIYKKLQPLVTEDCPFAKCPKGNAPVTWIKPKLVGEIKFSEWTKDRMARHPIFMGLREDKKAKDVVFEKANNMAVKKKASSVRPKAARPSAKKSSSKKAAAKKTAAKRASVKKEANNKSVVQLDFSAGNNQLLTLNSHELKLTNLNKLYWKKEKFSKGNMINYYLQIAPYMLPYMKDRPQSLNRHPNGIEGPNFYQKNQEGRLPSWMQTHKDFSESTNKTIEYLVCSNEATLIYMANLGCIEMHPWHSRTKSWQEPDWCLIDLDPDTPNTFEQVMEVAKLVKQILDSIGADAYVKTSGSTGLHIYVPLGAKYSFDQSRQLAELVVTLVNHEMPAVTSVERSPAKRKGKIYLDYLQNRQTQTAAAPYSLRPKPGVPVSTPLDWSELKKGLTSTTYNATTIFERLKTEGDLFKPVLGKGVNLEKVLKKLAGLVG